MFSYGTASHGYRINTGWSKDFIVKPFQAERVLEAVRKVFDVMKRISPYILMFIGIYSSAFCSLYYFTKFIGSKMSYSNTNKHIKVLDRVFLGNDKSICIIQIGNRFFVIGITNHHIELISELNEAEVVPISDDNSGSFSNIFEAYMNKLVNKR